jgi:hypothetical protein
MPSPLGRNLWDGKNLPIRLSLFKTPRFVHGAFVSGPVLDVAVKRIERNRIEGGGAALLLTPDRRFDDRSRRALYAPWFRKQAEDSADRGDAAPDPKAVP